MNFGEATEALKCGNWVRRLGWNGKGMHLYLEDSLGFTIGAGAFKGHRRTYEPCIVMFTADKKHQPGWVPSQADMLANDWEFVDMKGAGK